MLVGRHTQFNGSLLQLQSSEWPPLQMDIMINGCLIFRPEAFPCMDYIAGLV